jgi:hypothetical protein
VGRWWGKGIGGWIWCQKYVHVYVNIKMLPIETMSGIGGGGYKGER